MQLKHRVKPYLPAIERRELSLRKLAEILETNETYLCKVLKPTLKRSQSSTIYRRNRSVLKKTREKYRELLAIQVKNRLLDVETAAAEANCSVRTLYRYLARA
jgi:AraC-like DNA-binding protein